MGSFEEAENKRRSQAMADAQQPVPYWRQQRPMVEHLAERIEQLEQRTANLRRHVAELDQRVGELERRVGMMG